MRKIPCPVAITIYFSCTSYCRVFLESVCVFYVQIVIMIIQILFSMTNFRHLLAWITWDVTARQWVVVLDWRLVFVSQQNTKGKLHLMAMVFVSLANMYQHCTLEEIGRIIEENHRKVTPEKMLQRVLHFIEHMQREDHFDDDEHQNNLAALEKEFHANNAGRLRNAHLCVRPRELYELYGNTPYLWGPTLDESAGSVE